ncbi:unnamed protein product [Periconia digitata]|uniref:Uncharacterized protein n=1 Tax=Periconia digitata TaxID=1303443 RepID=A0A9W4XXB9_9PLEO|nr:unnamed protein product [Periconia digitata]
MAVETLHLSILDQCAVRCYTPILKIFPFPKKDQIGSATSAIQAGLQLTLETFPFLAGTVQPANSESGKLSVTYERVVPDVITANLFSASSILPPKECFHTYKQLKRDGMPQSFFTGEMFCPNALRNHPGVLRNAEGIMDCKHAVPVLAVEVFFIAGGLVLSMYSHHSVCDGVGMHNFWKHFAANVYCQRSGRLPPSLESFIDESTLRLQIDSNIPTFGKAPRVGVYGPCNYTPTLPDTAPCTARIFALSAERIRAMRDELGRLVKTVTPITQCNILAALVWIHVTRARHKRLVQHGHTDTRIGIAVNLRERVKPQLQPSYMGNMALMARATASIARFNAESCVTSATIVPAIQAINGAISNATNAWAQRHFAYFQSIDRIIDTEISLQFNRGPDLYITSWMHFGAEYEWDIPGTTSKSPEYIRRTHSPSDGGVIIMPRRIEVDTCGREAPYEVLIRLASEDMGGLVNKEGGLASWSERVIG